MYISGVPIRNKAFMLELKRQHPRLFELFYYEGWIFGFGPDLDSAYLQPRRTEWEISLPKYLWREPQERRIILNGSEAIELSIFGLKRYIELHKKKKETHDVWYNLDHLAASPSLHSGEHNGFKYDVRDHREKTCHWITRPMPAAEWRKILKTMLLICNKRYREAKAEEKKPKPRKPRRVPFKQSMYATVSR